MATKTSNIQNKYQSKQLLAPILLVSLLLNLLLILKMVPIDSVAVGCPNSEKHLSIFSNGWVRMKEAKNTAERLNSVMSQEADYTREITEGVSACDGVVYKLYIL